MADILAFDVTRCRPPAQTRTACAPAPAAGPQPTPGRLAEQRAADALKQPLGDSEVERIADVLLALEALRSPGDLQLHAIREPGDAAAAVCMRASGGLWWLTPAEAREVARSLRAERAFFGCGHVALTFERAAAEADRLDRRAAARSLGMTESVLRRRIKHARNLTLRSLSDTAWSLGLEVRISFRKAR